MCFHDMWGRGGDGPSGRGTQTKDIYCKLQVPREHLECKNFTADDIICQCMFTTFIIQSNVFLLLSMSSLAMSSLALANKGSKDLELKVYI